jgi:hypothetical protein
MTAALSLVNTGDSRGKDRAWTMRGVEIVLFKDGY